MTTASRTERAQGRRRHQHTARHGEAGVLMRHRPLPRPSRVRGATIPLQTEL